MEDHAFNPDDGEIAGSWKILSPFCRQARSATRDIRKWLTLIAGDEVKSRISFVPSSYTMSDELRRILDAIVHEVCQEQACGNETEDDECEDGTWMHI